MPIKRCVGILPIVHPTVYIANPSLDIDEEGVIKLSVQPGTWRVSIELSDQDADYARKHDMLLEELPPAAIILEHKVLAANITSCSELIGEFYADRSHGAVLTEKTFRFLKKNPAALNAANSQLTCNAYKTRLIDGACISSTHDGDGYYPVSVARNRIGGGIIGIRVNLVQIYQDEF